MHQVDPPAPLQQNAVRFRTVVYSVKIILRSTDDYDGDDHHQQ